jgi:hypothetical protein
MHKLSESEHIDGNATLADAIHQLVMRQSQSLVLTRYKKNIGILRLTDVFASVFHTMKQCFNEDN